MEPMNRTAVIVAVLAAIIVVVGWLVFERGKEEVATPAPPIETEPAPVSEVPPTPALPRIEAEPTQPEEPPLPELADSDEFVRERLAPMNLPEDWIDIGDYVPRLAVLMENASRGQLPRRQLQFLSLSKPFQVSERGDTLFVDTASYDRYDDYVQQLESVDVEQLASLLTTIEPLVGDALREIGVTAPPDEMMKTAIQQVLDTPDLPPGDVELTRVSLAYQYANPSLEALPPLQKQLLRMGPDNAARVKAYLRKVAAALNLDG